jgi:hypothetical protein
MVYIEIGVKYEEEIKKQKIDHIVLNKRLFISQASVETNFKTLSNLVNLQKTDFNSIIFSSEMDNLKRVN